MEYVVDAMVINADVPPSLNESAQLYALLERGREQYDGTVTVVGLAS